MTSRSDGPSLGAEFNAEIERGRAIKAGMRPEDEEPFVEPRERA